MIPANVRWIIALRLFVQLPALWILAALDR